MSLRLRLLVAVGVVALTALAIADVVTYQELRSFLFSRIDQSLEQSHIGLEGALGSRAATSPGEGPLPASGTPSPNGAGAFPSQSPPGSQTPSTTTNQDRPRRRRSHPAATALRA